MTDSRNERGSDGGDQSALQVADPEDYNSQRRLQQIHDARERFPEIRREARDKYNPNGPTELTREAYHERVANALLDYLFEVEPLVESLEDGDERIHYWTEQDVADGLTLEAIVENGAKVDVDDEDSDEVVPIDELTSRRAYRQANQFLAAIGLGLNLDTGGLPMIRGFDASREDADPTVQNAEMGEEPPL